MIGKENIEKHQLENNLASPNPEPKKQKESSIPDDPRTLKEKFFCILAQIFVVFFVFFTIEIILQFAFPQITLGAIPIFIKCFIQIMISRHFVIKIKDRSIINATMRELEKKNE
ncbi:MAG: hypothetical protein IJE01_01725 [Clostridia bacterium]|nr:hypothetical protein [Clostridia bacterium]